MMVACTDHFMEKIIQLPVCHSPLCFVQKQSIHIEHLQAATMPFELKGFVVCQYTSVNEMFDTKENEVAKILHAHVMSRE